jgi:alkylation response protein AidB-like acyl-CoA dehydrogenase
VNAPVEMMALNSSQTGSVQLTDVEVSQDEILHGPVEGVMQQGSGGGAGSLGTSVLAAGTTEGMLRHLREEMNRRPDLGEFVEPLTQETSNLVDQIRLAAAVNHPSGASASEVVRQKANSLVLRTAQTWLAATKGAGYVSGHRAERAVRESMFFLVWSCPQPVLFANLRELACMSGADEC